MLLIILGLQQEWAAVQVRLLRWYAVALKRGKHAKEDEPERRHGRLTRLAKWKAASIYHALQLEAHGGILVRD